VKQKSLFGRIALKKGLVSEIQLERALRFQEEIRALGLEKPLGKILVADGILAEGQVQVILRLQAINQRAQDARRFGRIALKNGFVDQDQLDAALALAQEEGFNRPLAMVLQAQGAMGARVARAIEQAMADAKERESVPIDERGVTGRLAKTLDLEDDDEDEEHDWVADFGFAAVAFREGLLQIPEIERALAEQLLHTEPRSLAETLVTRGVLRAEEVVQVEESLALARQERLRVPGYELLDVLGYGVTSVVLQARHTVLDREVAVKLFRTEHILTTTPEALVEEARAVAKVRHPNVVELYEVGRVRRRVFFVMELVRGPTLLDVLRNEGALSEAKTLRLAKDMLNALNAIHEAGLIHRDVKPQNILLEEASGDAKLTDLGLACEQGERSDEEEHAIYGSPLTMSPEQANGGATDARSDLYGLGATLFYALTETPPYEGNDTLTILMGHMTSPIPDPRERATGISEGMAEFVMRLLAKEPSDRPATASEALSAVEGLLAF
jgi:tRNA A-37 threonylcarbamoyl transferase component Bud32